VALLVALVVVVLFWAFRQIEGAADARNHAFIVINRANTLLSELKDAETGQRGYLLTGDEAFLEPYLAVRDGVSGHLEELRQLTLISAAHKHLDALVPLMDAELAEMSRVIELRRNNDMTAALAAVGSGQGKRLMDSIRAEMRSFIQIEEGAMAQHDAAFQSNMRHLFILIVIASLFALLFALLFAYLIYREALLKTGALQNAIFNSANFSSIATDAKGVIQIFNVGAERMLGYAAAEVLNKITPADISDPQEVIARAKALSLELDTPITPGFEALVFKASRGIEDIYELTYIRKDGSHFPAVVSVTALRDARDTIIGYLLIGTDNTARKRVEEQLRWTEESFRLMVESVTDYAIVMLDPKGRVVSWNSGAQRIKGYSAEEIVGQHFSRFYTREDIDRGTPQRDLDVVTARGRFEDEGWRARKDGSTFWANVVFTAIRDHGGNLRGFAKLTRDLTERRKVEAELTNAKSAAEKANLAKSDFLSSMSHELRSPLNAILGFAQLMESASPSPTDSQKESIAQILQAGWHLLKLINEILDLAVIESGKLSLSPESVSLSEVMSECQTMMEPQAQQRGIRMTFPRFDNLIFVRADRTRLKQIIINLLSNAIKYNKEQGTVVVDCTVSAPERIRISVADTGAGLPPEKLAQLFQPFNRLGQEAGAVAGTGIGLIVTKRLAELMEGAFGVESTVGVGSVFWCELISAAVPQLKIQSDEVEASVRPQLPAGASRRTLLYVEDNPANMKLVEQLIARCPDIRLVTAVNGTLGIDLARATQPQVILMDINLPGISGIEALKILREDPATAHIPVVALSANAMPRDIAKGLKLGFFRYITKPIKVKEFMDTLNAALEFAEKGIDQN
jgi:PAS domain S-box-containing protein